MSDPSKTMKGSTGKLDAREQSLLDGCLKNDRAAQESLYRDYYSEMMSVCLRYAKTEEEAAEILNDSFLKFFKGLQKSRPSISLRAWLRKLVVNTAIDHFRSNKRYYHAQDLEKLQVAEDHAETPLDAISAEELLKLIAQLPPSYRLVFNLYAIEGYSHPEIAERVGISVGTSKSNLAKARKKLQKMLKKSREVALV